MGLFGLKRKKSTNKNTKKLEDGDGKNNNSSSLTGGGDGSSSSDGNNSNHQNNPAVLGIRTSSSSLGGDDYPQQQQQQQQQLRLLASTSTTTSSNRNGSGGAISIRTNNGGLLFNGNIGSNNKEPTISMLPQLIKDIQKCKKTSSDRVARALRSLFTLSENAANTMNPNASITNNVGNGNSSTTSSSTMSTSNYNRVEMVRATTAHGQLVPTLLSFLQRCKNGSSEQYLVLLVLNNISIPSANKRIIALDHCGAKILCRLLCDNPSCHLMAIILVNLTFADAELRKELVSINYSSNADNGSGSNDNNIEIVESLAFALRTASLTNEEYESRKSVIEDCYTVNEQQVSEQGDNHDDDELGEEHKQDVYYNHLIGKVGGGYHHKNKQQHSQQRLDQKKNSPKQRLASLIAADRRLRSAQQKCNNELNYSASSSPSSSRGASSLKHHHDMMRQQYPTPPLLTDRSTQLFPETARWCLTALKNLTRPSADGITTAANSLVLSGIVPLLLEYICISATRIGDEFHQDLGDRKNCSRQLDSGNKNDENTNKNATSSPSRLQQRPPSCAVQYSNAPCTWDSNSMQDAALFIIMNLAANPSSRDHVKEADGVSVLTYITQYRSLHLKSSSPTDTNLEGENKTSSELDGDGLSDEEECQEAFQCIKAKVGLAFLLGSRGHFGQIKVNSALPTVYSSPDHSVLLLSDKEICGLVELLANTMHDRSKDGAGGYSAATFSVKYVLFAWRCLLTYTLNQSRVASLVGVQLNSLLLKALARHAISRTPTVDAEAAEHAAFALYLLSSYGFKEPFLPALYASPDARNCLAAKVFAAYLRVPTITSAGRHASEQLLLRLRHLEFKGRISEIAKQDGSSPGVSDLTFEDDLLARSETIFVEQPKAGAKPRPDIFDRPILRSRAPRRGNKQRAPWDNHASISVFPSALQAVQQLSYGSTKVRHVGKIDDIMIANNIANSANGEKTESYNYWWSWQDTAGEIQRNLERQRSQESASIFSGYSIPLVAKSSDLAEPFSIFGFQCLGYCSEADSTIKSP